MIRDESSVVLHTPGLRCPMKTESRHLQLQHGDWSEWDGLERMGWEADLEAEADQQRPSSFRCPFYQVLGR